MNREEIINKLQKIKALADSGDAGEREAADAMLQKMMDKYGFTEKDLDSEKEEVCFFKIHGCKCKDLFLQVAVIYCGVKKTHYIGIDAQDKSAKEIRKLTASQRPKGSNMVAICTPSKFLELQYAYEMFQKSLDKHLEGMFYVFLSKNDLLAPYDPNKPSNYNDEDLDIIYRMGGAVEKTEINKALSQPKRPV